MLPPTLQETFEIKIKSQIEEGRKFLLAREEEEKRKKEESRLLIEKAKKDIERFVEDAIRTIPHSMVSGKSYVPVAYATENAGELFVVMANHFVFLFKDSQVATAKVIYNDANKPVELRLYFSSSD